MRDDRRRPASAQVPEVFQMRPDESVSSPTKKSTFGPCVCV